MTRKRSVVWDYFKDICPESVICVLCRSVLYKHEQGSTTRMWRHLRTQHATEAAMAAKREGRGSSIVFKNEHQPMEIGEVEVEVEQDERDCDIASTNEDDIDCTMNSVLVTVQGEKPVKESPEEEVVVVIGEEHMSSGKSHRRSLIWKRFKRLGSLNAAQCLICKKKIMCHGGKASNLYRHMAKTHPEVNPQSGEAVNEAHVDSESNGLLGEDQGEPRGAVQEVEKVTVDTTLSSCSKSNRRSSIWKHFEPFGNLDVAQCLSCKKRIRCPDGKTSNMHRHMATSHSQTYRRASNTLKRTKTNTQSHTSSINQEICPVEVMDKADIAEVLQFPKVTAAAERRIFRRERELIEALRRTQREEAKALEHQKELVESLRAINAREAAIEKKQIESLRRAQQEEAKDLMRQREELEIARAEQEKKWEEIEQEKKQLLLICQEPTTPTLVSLQE